MSKTNPLNKFLKNINYSINNLLERNLNNLKFKNLIKIASSNKIILTLVALLIISLSYLLAPSFFIKDQIGVSFLMMIFLQYKLLIFHQVKSYHCFYDNFL